MMFSLAWVLPLFLSGLVCGIVLGKRVHAWLDKKVQEAVDEIPTPRL